MSKKRLAYVTKKRIQSHDLLDFACAIAEKVDFIRFISYELCKSKFHPFRIVKIFNKEVVNKSYYSRFNCQSSWNKRPGVK